MGLGRSFASLCRSQVLELSLGHDVEESHLSGKQVILIDLPELDAVGQERREEMKQLGEWTSIARHLREPVA